MYKVISFCSLIFFTIGLRAEKPIKAAHLKDATKSSNTSQNDYSKRWKPGFIVTLKGDTIMGKIKTMGFVDAYYDYQHEVFFEGHKGIISYSPKDLRSFSFAEGKVIMTMEAINSPDGTGLAFLHLYHNGPCKVYGYKTPEPNGEVRAGGSEWLENSSLVRKEKKYIFINNDEFFPLARIRFRENMTQAFTFYPEILAGLHSGAYTYKNWQALVNAYDKAYRNRKQANTDAVMRSEYPAQQKCVAP